MTTYFVIRHKPTGTLLSARVMATHFEFNTPARGVRAEAV